MPDSTTALTTIIPSFSPAWQRVEEHYGAAYSLWPSSRRGSVALRRCAHRGQGRDTPRRVVARAQRRRDHRTNSQTLDAASPVLR